MMSCIYIKYLHWRRLNLKKIDILNCMFPEKPIRFQQGTKNILGFSEKTNKSLFIKSESASCWSLYFYPVLPPTGCTRLSAQREAERDFLCAVSSQPIRSSHEESRRTHPETCICSWRSAGRSPESETAQEQCLKHKEPKSRYRAPPCVHVSNM